MTMMTRRATALGLATALALGAACCTADRRARTPVGHADPKDPASPKDPSKPKPDPDVPPTPPEPPPEHALSPVIKASTSFRSAIRDQLRRTAVRLDFAPERDYPPSAASFRAEAAAAPLETCELGDVGAAVEVAPAACLRLQRRDCLGQGLAHAAARRGDVALLEALRDVAGAALNVADAEGRTPLLTAIDDGQEGAVRFLAGQPGALAHRDAAERGVLHHVALYASRSDLPLARRKGTALRILAALLGQGADTAARDAAGMSAHDLAIRAGSGWLARALPKAPSVGAEATALHLLARHGDRFASARELDALIADAARDRADLEAVSDRGLTPLGEAIVWGEGAGAEASVRALAKAARRLGAPLPELGLGPAYPGWSPVRLAVWRDAVDLAKVLVALGFPGDPALEAATAAGPADPVTAGLLGPDGQTPAHYAAWHGNARWLEAALASAPEALLTRASDDAADADVAGWSVWHFAAAAARVYLLKRLVEKASPPLRALLAAPDAEGRAPTSLRPWRRPLQASRGALRKVSDLLAFAAPDPRRGSGLPTSGAGLGPGGGGGAGGGADDPAGGTGQQHGQGSGTRQEGKPEVVLEEIVIEGKGDGPGFSLLGFGGAFQVREYPADAERFGARLLEAPLPAMRGRDLPRRVPGELQPARRVASTCVGEGGWQALAASGSSMLAALDLADPFRPELAAETVLLLARASAEAGQDDAGAIAKAASLDALWGEIAAALALLGDELRRSAPGGRVERSRVAMNAHTRAASAIAAGHASLLLQRGRYDGAAEAFDRAVALVGGQPDALGLVLGQRAVLHTEQGAWKSALDDFAAARPLRDDRFGPGSAERVALDINEGVALEAVGRIEDAAARWTSALEAIVEGAEVPAALFGALAANNLGRLALGRGDLEGASAWAVVASDALNAMPSPPAWLAGRVALNLGDLARLGAPPFDDDADADDADRAQLRAERDAAARESYTRAAALLRQAHGDDHPLVGRATWRLAELEPDAEARRAAYAAAFVATRGAPDERWQLCHAWSLFEAGAGQEAAAYFLARAALEAIQRLRVEVRAADAGLESGWLDRRVAVFRHAAELALRLGRGGDAMAILGLKELETHLAFTRNAQVAGRAAPVPFDAREQREAAMDEAPSPLEPSGVLKRAKEIRRFLAALEAERPTQKASSMVLVEQAKLARSLQDVLRRVDRQAVWVHLVPTARAVTAIITTVNDQRVVTHPVAEGLVEARTVAFLDAILERSPRPEVPAAALHALILAPFEAHIGGAPVVYIAADGVLRDLPFGALHDGQRWLVERHAFVSGSMLTLHRLDRDPPPIDRWQIDAFGVSRAHAGFPALPGVPAELAAIVASAGRGAARGGDGGIFPGEVRLDDAFRPESLLATLDAGASPAVVIASHFKLGRADDDSFLLTGDGSKLSVACMEDCTAACLPACEASASGFSFEGVHLVVLSACQTARQMTSRREGRRRVADTQSSLADVAAVLGAHAVIGTLWPVNDPSTAAWMGAFFRSLHGQGARDKARAMQAASVRMASGAAGEDAWRHPFYWAPFVLIGNAR